MRLAQFASASSSASPIATRVLPVPVAWTMSAFRRLLSNFSATRLMAFSW